MLKIITCIKQVPMVSELPWDPKTGTLRRDLAEGMMDPASKNALETALELVQTHGGRVTAISMGPPSAEEVLREALAMGAHKGVLLTDKKMAGADTLVTSRILALAVEKLCPDFNLILCGCHTSDSETAQVGPQLAEALNIPGAAYVERLTLSGNNAIMDRCCDDLSETLSMALPGLATIKLNRRTPRFVSMGGIQEAFENGDVIRLGTEALGLGPDFSGIKGSPTKILDVYSPTAEKKNILLKGAPGKIANDLLEGFGDIIGAAIRKDLKSCE